MMERDGIASTARTAQYYAHEPLYIERAAEILGLDLAKAARLTPASSPRRGGLAPWQAKRIDGSSSMTKTTACCSTMVRLSGDRSGPAHAQPISHYTKPPRVSTAPVR